jgi:hypothetical protein
MCPTQGRCVWVDESSALYPSAYFLASLGRRFPLTIRYSMGHLHPALLTRGMMMTVYPGGS